MKYIIEMELPWNEKIKEKFQALAQASGGNYSETDSIKVLDVSQVGFDKLMELMQSMKSEANYTPEELENRARLNIKIESE